MSDKKVYTIPARFRKMENMHILFWLIKDTCWCLNFKWLGIAMIFPTLIVAIIICWRTRKMVSELTHNLAIIFWISANSFWMITEFWEMPDESRYYALGPFGLGLAVLVYYYGYYVPTHKGEEL